MKSSATTSFLYLGDLDYTLNHSMLSGLSA
jgi:hypothetical protein